ncbi:hypothetical protein E1B28_006135 [Marasmius oreades]|uniref:Uncharacterized protein n=1 Tax=Marasmius oreades TaxID=181124 RepID=A0A9P7S543_9AGAR|nr:uncharacterized protein E1B28_006135 [Marasmius oreades]KAG7095378.1 hypothetical protein E1B28_006135 [Marasmius oreades]
MADLESHDQTPKERALLVKESDVSGSKAEVEANSDPNPNQAIQPSEPTKSTATDEVGLEEEGSSDDEPQPPDFKGRGPISYNSSGRPKPSKPSKPR